MLCAQGREELRLQLIGSRRHVLLVLYIDAAYTPRLSSWRWLLSAAYPAQRPSTLRPVVDDRLHDLLAGDAVDDLHGVHSRALFAAVSIMAFILSWDTASASKLSMRLRA